MLKSEIYYNISVFKLLLFIISLFISVFLNFNIIMALIFRDIEWIQTNWGYVLMPISVLYIVTHILIILLWKGNIDAIKYY